MSHIYAKCPPICHIQSFSDVMVDILVSQLYILSGIILVTPNLPHHAIFSFTSCNRRLSNIVLALFKTRWPMMLKTIADPLQWLATCRFAWMGISDGQLKNDARSDWCPPKWPLSKQLHTAVHLFMRTPTGRKNAQLETSSAVVAGSSLR